MTIGWDESYHGRLRALVGDEPPLLFVGGRCVMVDDEDRALLVRRSDNGESALPAGAATSG